MPCFLYDPPNVGNLVSGSSALPPPFFSFYFYFNWRLITLQYCGGFAIHSHESAMGVHVSHHPEPPSTLPPHPIPLGCPRTPALSVLLHGLNLHWSSVLHIVIYLFQCYSLIHPTLAFSQIVQKSVLYICVSFAALHIGS